jgi:hypothetical protein
MFASAGRFERPDSRLAGSDKTSAERSTYVFEWGS